MKAPLNEAQLAGKVKGGIARAAKLSPERRKEIARLAAKTRWQNNACTSEGDMQ